LIFYKYKIPKLLRLRDCVWQPKRNGQANSQSEEQKERYRKSLAAQTSKIKFHIGTFWYFFCVAASFGGNILRKIFSDFWELFLKFLIFRFFRILYFFKKLLIFIKCTTPWAQCPGAAPAMRAYLIFVFR